MQNHNETFSRLAFLWSAECFVSKFFILSEWVVNMFKIPCCSKESTHRAGGFFTYEILSVQL